MEGRHARGLFLFLFVRGDDIDAVRFVCAEIADSDDAGQGFQLKAATIPIEGGQCWPVGTFMGSQRR
jgi:hypothetical protein